MKNYVMPGDALPFTASGALTAGAVHLVGSMIGIVQDTVANGEDGLLVLKGVYDIAKIPSQAWTVGQAVYWDFTNSYATGLATGNRYIGTAVSAVGSGADEIVGRVRFDALGADPRAIAGATIVPAAGGANITLITITMRDANGAAVAAPVNFDVWLSDAATGAGLNAVDASGTVVAAAGGGTVLGTYTAKKALRVQTTAAGTFVLQITDTAKTGWYPCVQVPGTGRTIVGAQLVTANYG
jgi:predicted RecA/RadA family phage recombinase